MRGSVQFRSRSLLFAAVFLMSSVAMAQAGELDVTTPSERVTIPPDGMQTLYHFYGARQYDSTTVVGAMTATYCTYHGPTPPAPISVLFEFYPFNGGVASSLSLSFAAPDVTITACTSPGGTSRKVGCSGYMDASSTASYSAEGFIRVLVPKANAKSIFCSAEVSSGTDGGSSQILHRLEGVRAGKFKLPKDPS